MLEASSFNYELQITNYDKLKKTKTNVMLEASSFNYELQITNYDKLKKTKTNVMLEASSLILNQYCP